MYAEKLLSSLTITSSLPDESAVLRFMAAAISSLPEVACAWFDDNDTADISAHHVAIPVQRGGQRFSTLHLQGIAELPRELIEQLRGAANMVALEISRRRLQRDMESQIEERTAEVAKLLERFEIASSATGIGLWEWNPQADLLQWDDRMHALFGLPADEFSGRYEDWRKMVIEQDIETAERSLTEALEKGEDFDTVFRIRTPSGRIKYVRGAAKAIYDDAGQPVRVVGTNVDVSEIYELNDQLRHAQRLESIGQLTGGIAHDMNNILGAIVGNADLLLSGGPTAADPDSRALVETLISAAERGQSLTSRLLAFARQDHLSPDDIDLPATLEGLNALVVPTLADNIYLSMRFEPDLPLVRVDQHQFENSVLNLVINSRDAMPNGGLILIEGKHRDLQDQELARALGVKPDSYVEIVVSDNGIGMDEAFLDHVIEPFFSSKPPGQGTGLGLSMVHGFVLQSGGQMQITSKEGEGTTVSMLFPVAKQNRHTSSDEPDVTASDGAPEAMLDGRVLLIEDDQAVAAVAGKFLELFGLTVLKAADGESALPIFREHQAQIDVVLTDISLAGPLNGFEVADAIREVRPELPVIFSSGYPEAFERSGSELVSGVNFLQKPYRRADLREILLSHLHPTAAT